MDNVKHCDHHFKEERAGCLLLLYSVVVAFFFFFFFVCLFVSCVLSLFGYFSSLCHW